jgi:hypothetical protein
MLKTIACYGRVFEGLGGAALASYIHQKAIASPGFFEHCQHKHEIDRRAAAWARSAEVFYWPLGELPTIDRTKLPYNAYRATEARERIAAAVRLVKHQALAIRELAAAIVREARCSLETLYKHADLWHPDRQGVTGQPAGLTESLASIQQQIRESLESTDNRAVTPCHQLNEVLGMISLPKNSPSTGAGVGVQGEGEGILTGWPPSPGWSDGIEGTKHD